MFKVRKSKVKISKHFFEECYFCQIYNLLIFNVSMEDATRKKSRRLYLKNKGLNQKEKRRLSLAQYYRSKGTKLKSTLNWLN